MHSQKATRWIAWVRLRFRLDNLKLLFSLILRYFSHTFGCPADALVDLFLDRRLASNARAQAGELLDPFRYKVTKVAKWGIGKHLTSWYSSFEIDGQAEFIAAGYQTVNEPLQTHFCVWCWLNIVSKEFCPLRTLRTLLQLLWPGCLQIWKKNRFLFWITASVFIISFITLFWLPECITYV